MKSQLIILGLISLSLTLWRNDELPDPEAYFSAIIVSDLDQTAAFFQDGLGFKVLDRIENKERGFKQSNLRRGKVLVELIELDSAVSPRNAIANFNDRTRIEGIFKIGFLISDFNKWVAHLRKQKVDFHGDVVTDNQTGKRMVIIKDPDGNRIQLFEK